MKTLGAPIQHDLHRFAAASPLLLLAPALILSLLAWQSGQPEKMLTLALALFVFGPLATLLIRVHQRLGLVASLIGFILLILAASIWLETSFLLMLLVLPVLVGALAMGLQVAVAVAATETVTLLILASRWPDLLRLEGYGVSLLIALVWLCVAIVWSIYRPIHDLADWSWEHYMRAQALLEEARDRQAELKQALEALGHANRELALMNERLATLRAVAENAQKAKAAFASSVSHEFRTPLNIIIGLSELLLDTPKIFGESLGAQTREAVTVLYRNCEHLASMIDDVLDLSQVEAGRLAVQRRYVDLGALIQSALTVVMPLLERKGLDLQVTVPPDLPEVYCDATRIRQVILNLVSNATRFTERGGIQVAAHVRDSQVVVSVRDTGPGIAPEDVQRIFQPFQQAGVHLPGKDGGHGLGLAISKQFVDLHQGRMWLESQPGEGSNFCFELPITPLTNPAAPPERWIKEDWVTRTSRAVTSSARLAERMILCDEVGELLPLLRRYADHTEFVGAATLAAVTQALEETPAQAVLINAPDLNMLLRNVEQLRSVVPDIPVIGCSLPRKDTHALHAGALGYLLKPLHQADLKRILASAGNPPQRILIVDDEEDTLWFMEQLVYVCCEGTDVLCAKSGEEALERMADWRPDLVLLDIVMPDMDGWQVLERKAMDPDLAGIPVAIISAQEFYETPSTQQADGTDQVMTPIIVAAMGDGLSIGRLLQCAEAISSMLLQPD